MAEVALAVFDQCSALSTATGDQDAANKKIKGPQSDWKEPSTPQLGATYKIRLPQNMKTQGLMFHFSPVLLTDSSDRINQEKDAPLLSYYGFVLKQCFEMFVFLFKEIVTDQEMF